MTASGDAEISTTQSKFGGSSLGFSSGYAYVVDTPELYLDDHDFTIEMWYYKTGSGYTLAGQWGSGGNSWFIGDYFAEIAGISSLSYSAPSSNQWQHFALCRRASNVQVFVDGASVASDSIGTSALAGSSAFIGIGGDEFGNTPLGGYIDEFRIVVGTCIYGPDNFTPPTAPF